MGVLQVQYRWGDFDNWTSTLNLFQQVNMRDGLGADGDLFEILDYMQGHPDYYWFQNEYHAMACATLPRTKLWYDIETGLWAYPSIALMRWDICNEYRGPGNWWAFRCSVG